MSDLEDRGFLDHPYTSAGRVPTELGYRTFVDQLMKPSGLSNLDQASLKAPLEGFDDQPEVLLRECSRILGRLSNFVGRSFEPSIGNRCSGAIGIGAFYLRPAFCLC